MAKLPKLIITDIDGVWTDGSMYYDQTGNEFKRFHTYDSAGVMFARLLNIPVAILTGETTDIVNRRATKLKIDYLFQGVTNKVETTKIILEKLKIGFEDCAFIGDDINDIELLGKVGFSGTTANAPDYIKLKVNYITQKKGGEGAFREFVEYILRKNEVLEKVLEMVLFNNGESS